METKVAPIRVLIVEDSLVARELLVSILQNAPGFQVIGAARNGLEAVTLTRRLQPDVIAMDVYMPEMDGLEATRQIMAQMPRPIVMVSASFNKNESKLSFDALQAGALSILEKPTINDPPEAHELLINQLRLMSEVKVVRRWDKSRQAPVVRPKTLAANGRTKIQLMAIASSTGGPGVLAKILCGLPADFPAPVLIVQHIMASFAAGLATWLNQLTTLEVRLAQDGDKPQAGQVLIAPDSHHLLVSDKGLITLNQSPPLNGLRPSANYLFKSVAQVYGPAAIGVILTGMGNDGAEGLLALRQTGAHTIAQDETSCVVFGMPAVAIELGAAEQVLPADKIAAALLTLV